MQLPFHGQLVGMPAQLPSSCDIPGTFPSMAYGRNNSMDSLDCLGDVGLFAQQQSDSVPDYSDLTQAASQMQVRPHLCAGKIQPLTACQVDSHAPAATGTQARHVFAPQSPSLLRQNLSQAAQPCHSIAGPSQTSLRELGDCWTVQACAQTLPCCRA